MQRTTINLVELRGRISHIYSTPKVTLITIVTRDYKQQRQKEDRRYPADSPTVSFFGKEAEGFSEGDMVTIKAHNQSTYDPDRLTSRQECWGDSIERQAPVFSEAGADSGIFEDDLNRFIIRGKVERVTFPAGSTGMAFLTVETTDGTYQSHNAIVYSSRDVRSSLARQKVAQGATVEITGRFTTRKKRDERGKLITLSSLRAFRIQVVIPASPEVLEKKHKLPQVKEDIIPTIGEATPVDVSVRADF
jgi:hypothetical protein